jgi:hypothetical protein
MPCSRQAHSEQQARKNARERVKAKYRQWCHEQMIFYTDLHRKLRREKEIAKVALRHPDFFSWHEVNFWQDRLTTVKEELTSIESDSDIFTFDRFQSLRFRLFRSRNAKNANG